MELNPANDWAQLMHASFSQLQGNFSQLRQVTLGAVAQELAGTAKLDSLPQSVRITDGTTLALMPQFSASTLGDVLQHVQTMDPSAQQTSSWSLGQCIDYWARSQPTASMPQQQQQGAGGSDPSFPVHRSVVLNAGMPLLPGLGGTTTTAGIGGATFLGQHLPQLPQLPVVQTAAIAQESARRAAAAQARASRQQKRREMKQRQEMKRKREEETVAATAKALPPLPLSAAAVAALAPGGPSSALLQQPDSKETGKVDQRAIKNRESAARSRAKRVEYTAALEAHVERLREQNKHLRTKVIHAAPAPPDPHAGQMDGKPLRRTRTMPL